MALAKIILLHAHTYTRGTKTYKKDQPVTTTDVKEIAFAKSNGYFMVADLEAERAALDAEIAKHKAAETAATNKGKGKSFAAAKKAAAEEDGPDPFEGVEPDEPAQSDAGGA